MPAEERKLATVVFADLVGSTELAGGQDPERVRVFADAVGGGGGTDGLDVLIYGWKE